ncbi:hypothetical protein [Paenibacillus sp. TH7-28]
MTTKRTDPFRYTLTPPLACKMEITHIDDMPLQSKPATVDLIDINKSGCRIGTGLNLHASAHHIRAAVHIQLNEKLCVYHGEIRWQEEIEPAVFHYGLSLELSPDEKEQLNIELRSLAASGRIVVL